VDPGAMTVADALPVSVIVPTLGRRSLRACLESLAACDPRPAEVVVVSQDDGDAAETAAEGYGPEGARVIRCAGRGVAAGRNLGLHEALHDVTLITDDDCTVAQDWVGRAWALLSEHPDAIVTGRVLPAGDPRAVPSWKDDPLPHDFTGSVHGGALFPNNMACDRRSVLAAGGFDERFGPDEAAEDNEFCYRWLRAGGALRYEPSLVVRHHDWRSVEELRSLYVRYARGQGFFYAKHLRHGDLTMLRWIVRDVYWWLRSLAAPLRRDRGGARPDPRRGIARGLPAGFRKGWKVFA
jgi:GT2 family glycosyltransferase